MRFAQSGLEVGGNVAGLLVIVGGDAYQGQWGRDGEILARYCLHSDTQSCDLSRWAPGHVTTVTLGHDKYLPSVISRY